MSIMHIHIKNILSLIVFSLAAFTPSFIAARERLDLSGEWGFRLDNVPDSVKSLGSLSLPGTLDTNGVGIPVPESDNTSQLSRRVTFSGNATYSKTVEIPESWRGKDIELFIERTRPATVTIDGITAGSCSRISSPHRYNLSRLLSPGSHRIEVTVNNSDSIPLAIRNNSHACTESTQTNWNGLIGEIHLEARNPLHIASAKVFPKTARGGYKIAAKLSQPADAPFTLRAEADEAEPIIVDIPKGATTCDFLLPLPFGVEKWSEWSPRLDNIRLSLVSQSKCVIDNYDISCGYRSFTASGSHFAVNGDPVFLRGRHDACVFPLTAHTPMDLDHWRKYFRTLKQYGLNHVRFHSWCPPEACFRAADEEGFYLQPELPIWGEIDKDRPELLSFLQEDMEGILEEYGSHPSFVMFAIGNELWGDTDLMRTFIDRAREVNPGLLATYGSNIYLGWKGHIEGEDFLVTCRVGSGDGFSTHTRASFSYADADNGGIMNSTYPNSQMNFSHAAGLSKVPVVGHETAQYQFYPDFSGNSKYTGVLRPDNLAEFEKRAKAAGTFRKNKEFFNASGKWASKLYLADMEMNLRTPNMGGFQLLDIQDYPGQGTALVGILDPFMESKGIISPEEWRRSCAPLTILAEFPKFCFTEGEEVTVPVKVSNYTNNQHAASVIDWSLPFDNGRLTVTQGKGLVDAGEIKIKMPGVKKPTRMELSLRSDNNSAENIYTIWVYPWKMKKVDNVTVTTDMEEALALLNAGKRVILCPDSSTVAEVTLGPLFQTDYWNYRMFRTICDKIEHTPSPGTMGLMIDNSHPAFENYPTDSHTDWQWFPVVHNSYPLIIDRLPKDVDPVVEVIDNVERNYRLALMLECNVGKGKLMIINTDIEKAAEHPEGAWLLQSVKEYMGSKKCKPTLSLEPEQVRNLLTKPSTARLIKEIRNESYNSQWE